MTTVYVDGKLGADVPGQGGAPGAGAFRTVAYAYANSTNPGGLTIDIAAGTHEEVVGVDFRATMLTIRGAHAPQEGEQ